MQTLSSDEERKLLTGVKQAVDLVDNQAYSPDDAMTKVARDCGWSRGELRSAVSAFNNGRQVAQWRANDNALDKLASFPLADYDKIADAIWGGTAKQASDHLFVRAGVSPEYREPPTWLPQKTNPAATMALPAMEKVASDGAHPLVTAHNQQRDMIEAWNRHRDASRRFEDARTKYAAAHDMVRIQLRLLEGYFSKAAMDRMSFAAAEDAVTAYHGNHGRALFDLLAQSFPREKRAADVRIYHDQPLNRELPPFTHVTRCLQAARDVALAKIAMDEAFQSFKEAEDRLRPFVQGPRPSQSPPSVLSPCLLEGGEKTAGLGQMVAGGMVDSATKTLIDKALNSNVADRKVDRAWTELEDPEHENDLRTIRIQAMLSSMMSDPDNPIAGFNPDEVLSNYNELSQLAPRVAEQPAAVGPLLAQRLAGKSQPFEVNEALNIEKGLKDSKVTTPKTRSLLDAPDSLLG